jgi:hypothetical protein
MQLFVYSGLLIRKRGLSFSVHAFNFLGYLQHFVVSSFNPKAAITLQCIGDIDVFKNLR